MEDCDRDIGFHFPQRNFDIRIVKLAEGESQGGKLRPKRLEHFWKVMSQGSSGGGKSKVMTFLASQTLCYLVETREERINEVVELFPGWCKSKRAALEKFHTEKLLQFRNLTTHGRLLNAIWHIADGLGDSFELCDEVKQFEMMDVHADVWGYLCVGTDR